MMCFVSESYLCGHVHQELIIVLRVSDPCSNAVAWIDVGGESPGTVIWSKTYLHGVLFVRIRVWMWYVQVVDSTDSEVNCYVIACVFHHLGDSRNVRTIHGEFQSELHAVEFKCCYRVPFRDCTQFIAIRLNIRNNNFLLRIFRWNLGGVAFLSE